MKKKNIVLSVLLSAAVFSSSFAPAFASEDQMLTSETAPIESNVDVKVNSGFISGQLTEKSNESPENIVKKFYIKDSVSSEKKNYSISSQSADSEQPVSEKQFKITKQFKNSMGRNVVKTIQTFNNVPVYGTDQNYHVNDDGVIECISGKNIENIESKVVPCSSPASKEDVLKAVENHLGVKPEYTEAPEYELFLYPVKDTYVYSYKVSVKFNKPSFGDYDYFIDANNLSILEIYTNIASVEEPAIGSGIGQFGTVKQNLKMVKDDTNTYFLKNTIENTSTYSGGNISFSERDSFFDSGTPENYQKDAVDAHYNMSNVLKFFKDTFNRDGNDGNGTPYGVLIDASDNSLNAYGSQNFMRFAVGHGNGLRSTSCALDASAHEFTHGMLFCEGLALPWYLKGTEECVSLHEGISDVFGTICEHYLPSDGLSDWLMGEDTGETLRDCANPEIDNYNDYLNSTRECHLGGGVISKAAYLMAEGGTQNGVTVTAIGYDKMANIFYKTVNDGYLVSEMQFRPFAEAAVQAASLLYGINSPEIQTVKDAFSAVGIFKDLLKSLTLGMRSGLRIELSWDTGGVYEATFGIYRKYTESTATPEKIAETTDSKVSFETLVGSCDYYLAKVDSQGNRISDFSTPLTFECYYQAPQNFTVSNRTGLRVQFSWTNTFNTTYAIYRKATASTATPEKIAETTNTVLAVDTLLGSYDFYVAMLDSNGYRTSYFSDPITLESSYPAPQNFSMTNRSGLRVQFSWSATPDAKYAIFRKAAESTSAPEKIDETTDNVLGVDTFPGSYNFYVAQIDSNGYTISFLSQPITVDSYMLAPENFALTNRDGLSVQFSWEGTSGNTYAIYRKAAGSTDAPEKLSTVTASTASVDTLTGSYDFYVAQVDASGYRISNFSTAVNVVS